MPRNMTTQIIEPSPEKKDLFMTGYKGFTTNEDVAEDLFDDSPDVRRFDKRKLVIMDYMKRALTN